MGGREDAREKPPRVKYGPILYSAVGEGVLGNWNPGITGLAMRGRKREREREMASTRCAYTEGSKGSWRNENRGDELYRNEIQDEEKCKLQFRCFDCFKEEEEGGKSKGEKKKRS